MNMRVPKVVVRAALPMLVTVLFALGGHAQTFSVLHSFSGGADGSEPSSGLTMDRAGNLYGTALFGGSNDFGVVFKMVQHNSSWIARPL